VDLKYVPDLSQERKYGSRTSASAFTEGKGRGFETYLSIYLVTKRDHPSRPAQRSLERRGGLDDVRRTNRRKR